ncbi:MULTISPECIES: 16S rRNA pseudouridine(516) synthase [Streptococcus]|uniref:16S rRNA pseudouridine(516) synthase n=1 Tax=Streptococcus TaxID=1301 RepID=UPI001020D2D2|nr:MULTISPECIES: 16S rRNA pseudouridine(516) synthase [unclassified Streptococcus]MTQ41933.1 pseudouridine synthase [Streptococcus sp. BIOML-A1]RYS61189.1 16S rRNA pseudouridine(516) synthase [Streptococcus sp. bf_0095]
MRLDQLLAHYQIPRKEIKQSLAKKQILVDGLAATKLSQNVDTGLQEVRWKDQVLTDCSHHYFLLHKPQGLVTATKDAQHPTVLDLLRAEDRTPKTYPIGRLDRDTTVLLLLTDNGPLGFQLLHPQYHIEKKYEVTVNGPLEPAHIEEFQEGITFLDGKTCKPAKLKILNSSPKESQALVTLSEGKFHQVKKMFLSVGVKVTSLKRIKFGDFSLDPDLTTGDYRPLNQDELQIIKNYLENN